MTQDPAPLRLRLVATRADGDTADLELEARSDTTLEDAVEALADALGERPDGLRAFSARTGRPLDASQPLSRAGLRHGDELVLSRNGVRPTHRRPADERFALAVVGGPAAGPTAPLPSTGLTVGRGGDLALDDPSLSGRHLRFRVDGDGVSVEDLGSRNGTSVEGVRIEPKTRHPLEPGQVVQAGRTLLAVTPAAPEDDQLSADADGTIPFNRPPRIQKPLTDTIFPVPAPPNEPHRGRIPFGASLIPLALGIGLYLLTKIPTMLFFSLLSPVMAISTYIEDRRSGRRSFAKDREHYHERLSRLRDELERERERELRTRRETSPAAPELLRRARTHAAALWERRPADPDFLSLRLGSGEQPSTLRVRVDPGGSEALRAEAEGVGEWYGALAVAPTLLPLGELGAAGLCGPEERVAGLARWLVAQAATLHSPRELAIAAVLSPERLEDWDWLKWLPHTAAATSPTALRLVCGATPARELFEEAAGLVRRRIEDAEALSGSKRKATPALLLIVDEDVAPERPLVAQVLGRAAEAAVGVLWLGRERRDLPGECGGIVELDAAVPRLAFTDARAGRTWDDVTADCLSAELARGLALDLAPVRDTSTVRGGGVPDRIALLELLGLAELGPPVVERRWAGPAALRPVPIGAAAQEPFAVDLRRDGPHALVAGTTGAGKSELLQTFIAALALEHPPERLSFLLVDYKGGAAFKECIGLPHTVGFVTDLDGHLAQRALVSLNAELRRREHILRDAGAKDLLDMETRDAANTPASLLIVIDEFATLAKEVPEFVDGVVDVAQRGRSLGVHLLLATQRPGGVVSENIRANTNLRVALRVNETGESSDVIGAPDAARIPRGRPGRAYARTGHGELTEFQTAYVGGTAAVAREAGEVVVRELAFETGRPATGVDNGDAPETDLTRIVRTVAGAAESGGHPRAPSPWLPPLEPVLPLGAVDAADAADPSARAVVGLLDEPSLQRQRPLDLDLEREGSVLVYGTSGSGKTTLLRTLALSLAERSGPEGLNVYGLDFATRGLGVLEALPQVGSIVAGEDEERVARLFALLRRAIESRKNLFAARGVFTLAEYNRAVPESPLPRVVVLLDGYSGFVAAFERVDLGALVDALPRLVGDGRPLGVHFAITADRRGAVPNALAGIVPTKIVLRMADEDEFASLGVPLKVVRGAQLPPGRGFLPSGLELQVAVPGEDPGGEAQAAAIATRGAEVSARHGGRRARAVEAMPTRVDAASLPAPDEPLEAVVGVGDAELEAVAIELAERHFLVVGPYRSGRSTTLAAIAGSLARGPQTPELRLLAPRRSPLAQLGLWKDVVTGTDACENAALLLSQEIEQRSESAPPLVIVVDDAEELAESLGAAPLETVVRRGRDLDVRIVAACERTAAQRAFSGWLRELRKEEHGLLLMPDADVDGDILGVRLPRRTNPVYPPGRGYLVVRGTVGLVQVAAAESATAARDMTGV
jgi:DNA segregation ATPase FtsK/SpoIIIE, S-DNA-T family